jgi:serine/threonine-protein kinase RsbW
MTGCSVRLTIESRAAELHRIGEALGPICTALGMSGEERGRVELAVVEAVTNVIRHAYGNRPGHPIEVALEASPGCLVVEVRDHGQAMAAEALAHAQLPEAGRAGSVELRDGGLGLGILKAVMDAVEYGAEGDANVLRLTKRLPAGS